MYVSTAIELLKQLDPDEEIVIQWYSKQHIEENLDTHLTADQWEYVCENQVPASMADFGIPELLAEIEEEEENESV